MPILREMCIRDSITALQMDNKATGLTFDILARALQQAKEGRAFILQKMLDVIPEPRHTTRSTAPRIVSIQVPTDKIRDVIGSGGKVIRGIQDETGASVDIQELSLIHISCRSAWWHQSKTRRHRHRSARTTRSC